MYSKHLTPTSNLQGLKKDGEFKVERKHKASVKPVTSKTATSSPTLTNPTTCTSKSTDSTAITITAKPTTCNSQQLSTKPSTSKPAQTLLV